MTHRGLELTRDGRVGGAHGDGRGRGRTRGGDLLTDSPVSDGTLVSVGSSVSLTESRGGSVGELRVDIEEDRVSYLCAGALRNRRETYRVETGGLTDIGLTRGEGVVVVHVHAGHDESAAHDVELAEDAKE